VSITNYLSARRGFPIYQPIFQTLADMETFVGMSKNPPQEPDRERNRPGGLHSSLFLLHDHTS
jgi:hypothetical protein